MRRRLIYGVGIAVILAGAAVATLAQLPPPIPSKHIPIDPNLNAQTCFTCHQSAGLPDITQVSFCTTCHINIHVKFTPNLPVTKAAPRAKHPLVFEWKSAECAACHRLQHNGMNPTHQISATMANAGFCLPCHLTPQPKTGAVTGEEKVGDFCALCHSLGVTVIHPTADKDKKADFCLACHTPPKT